MFKDYLSINFVYWKYYGLIKREKKILICYIIVVILNFDKLYSIKVGYIRCNLIVLNRKKKFKYWKNLCVW